MGWLPTVSMTEDAAEISSSKTVGLSFISQAAARSIDHTSQKRPAATDAAMAAAVEAGGVRRAREAAAAGVCVPVGGLRSCSSSSTQGALRALMSTRDPAATRARASCDGRQTHQCMHFCVVSKVSYVVDYFHLWQRKPHMQVDTC